MVCVGSNDLSCGTMEDSVVYMYSGGMGWNVAQCSAGYVVNVECSCKMCQQVVSSLSPLRGECSVYYTVWHVAYAVVMNLGGV